MRYNIAALVCGFLFGCGLTISNIIDPNKILNFLDFTGNWDPSLAFVMLGAVLVAWIGYRFVLRKSRPLLAEKFNLPERKCVDGRLIFGSAIFGIGWGLAGYCPGPAITAIGLGIMDAMYFVIGMIISSIIYQIYRVLSK